MFLTRCLCLARVCLSLPCPAPYSLAEAAADALFDGTNLYSLEVVPERKKEVVKVGSKEYEVATVECAPLKQEDALQFMNIVVRKAMESHKNFKRIFDEYYDLSKPLQIEDDRVARAIGIFPGWLTEISLRVIAGKPQYALSVDPAHKVVSTVSVLHTVIRKLQDPAEIKRAMRGKRVTTNYNYKTYGVDDIDFKMTPKHTFKRSNRRTGEEETITFVAYYKEMGVNVTDLSQPLIVATGRQRERIYLLPEFCVPAAVPAIAKRKLPQITSVKPTERVSRINALLHLISAAGNASSHQILTSYGLQIGTATLPVAKHVVLPSPPLIFAPSKQIKLAGKSEWRAEAAQIKYSHVTTKRPVRVLIVYDTAKVGVGAFATDYWKLIKDKMRALDSPVVFNAAQDTVYGFDAAKYKGDFQKTLADAVAKLPATVDPKEVLVVAFLADSRDSADYDAYREFCLHRGFVGQGIDASDEDQKRKMDPKNQDSIVTNIARQIVNKFGYQSWWYAIPQVLPKQAQRQFLSIGIDVFHAPPMLVTGEKGKADYWQKRSIAGYTAKLSLNQTTLLFCSSEVRDAGAEIAGQHLASEQASSSVEEAGAALKREQALNPQALPLASFVQAALTHWQSLIKPELLTVIVYRDGVADSQMDAVDASEVAQLQHVVPPAAHFIYSIVQKRVHNRFVMSDQGRFGNCASGTVVEDTARAGPRYNFFMLPCATNLSTSKPVHYTITHDSKPDALTHEEFHAITFAGHHTYQNWAGTVKVPDVCQYAHKLAYTLGESHVRDPIVPKELKDTMFYL